MVGARFGRRASQPHVFALWRQRPLELRAVDPALATARRTHLDPVGAPPQQLYFLAAVDDKEHWIAAPGPAVELEIRVAHDHLLCAGVGRCRDRHQRCQHNQRGEQPSCHRYQSSGAVNGSLKY
jgi:hypothetical protein